MKAQTVTDLTAASISAADFGPVTVEGQWVLRSP